MRTILLCFSLCASLSIEAELFKNTAKIKENILKSQTLIKNDTERMVQVCAMFSTFITDIARQRDAGIDYKNNQKNSDLHEMKLDALGAGVSVGSVLSHAVEQTPFLKPDVLSSAYGKTCIESKISLLSPDFGNELKKYKGCNKFSGNNKSVQRCVYQIKQ